MTKNAEFLLNSCFIQIVMQKCDSVIKWPYMTSLSTSSVVPKAYNKSSKQCCHSEGNECVTGDDTWHLAITVLPSSCHGCILLMSRAWGRHAENSPLWFAEDITCKLRCPSAASIPEGCAAPEIPSCIFNEKLERYLIVTLLTCSQSMCFVITLTYLTSKHPEESGDFQTDADAADG